MQFSRYFPAFIKNGSIHAMISCKLWCFEEGFNHSFVNFIYKINFLFQPLASLQLLEGAPECKLTLDH